MQLNTQFAGLARQLVVGIMLCLLYSCSVAPKTVAVGEDAAVTQAKGCDDTSDNCKSSAGERYHYYLGLLSVYLIGL